MIDFQLTDQDKATSLWVRLRAHMEDRLADARKKNDAVQPEPNTAALRGEIACLKKLIGLGADRPVTGEWEQPQ